MVEPKKEISVRIEAPSKGETHQITREPLVSIGCGDSPPAVTGLTSMFQTLSLSGMVGGRRTFRALGFRMRDQGWKGGNRGYTEAKGEKSRRENQLVGLKTE